MADKSFGIIVTGDISDIEEKLGGLVDLLNGLVDKLVNIGVTVEDSQVEELETQLSGLDNQTLNETVDVDESDIKETQTQLDSIDGQVLNETINVEDTGIEEATTKLDQMGVAGEQASTQVTTSMDGAVKSVEELGTQSQDTAQKTEEIGNKSTETGEKAEAGMNTALLAVAALTAGLEIAAQEVQDLNIYFDKVSGAIPEEEMRDWFADLTNAKFPIDEAKLYVTLLKQMGVTSQDVLAKGARDFNNIRLAVGASTDMMKKFASSVAVMGIDLANLPSAFNAIAYANANVIGGFDAYVQWMQKYDSAFKEMGLNIDQTAVIIAAATKKWGGGRAAYQGLNEAMKEAGGNLDVLEEKLGMQAGTLDNASEMTAKYSGKIEKNADIARDHTTVLQQSGDVVDDVNLKYGDLIETIGSLGAAFAGLAGFLGLLAPKLLSIWDDIWGTNWQKGYTEQLSRIISKIKSFGSDIGAIIKGWAPSWGSEAGKSAEGIGKAIEGNVERPSIWSKFKDFGARVRGFITKDWAIWTDDAGRVTADMVKGMDGTWTAKSPGFLEKIANFGRRVPQVLSEAVSGVGLKLPSLERAGSLIPEGIGAGITKGLPKLLGKLGEPLTAVTLAAEGIYNYSDYLEQNPVEFMWNIVMLGTYDLLPQQIRDFLDAITGWLSPESLGKALLGESGYTDLTGWLTENISNPFREWVDSFWENVGKLPKFDLMAFLFGGGDDPNAPTTTWFGKIMEGVRNLPGMIWDALSGITKIDLMALIFGLGGDTGDPNNVSPLWAFTEGIKNDILGLIAWLTTIPSQIVGFLGQIPVILQEAFAGFMEWLAALPENLGRAVGDAIILVLQGIYYFLETLISIPGQFMEAVYAAWDVITQVFRDFANFIINLPGQIVEALNNLAAQIEAAVANIGPMIQGAWNTVTQVFTDFASFIWNLPGQVYASLVDLGNQIISGLVNVPGQTKAGLDGITAQFWNFINWLTTLPGMVWGWVTKTFNDMVGYIYSIPDQVKAGLDGIIQKFWDFIHWIESLPGRLYDAIVNAWNGFLKGLSDKFPEIEGWLQKIRDLFPHSPPKTGPLIDIMDWGGNMADAIQSGIDKKFPGLVSNFADKMQELKNLGTGLSADMGDLSGFSMSRSTMEAVSAPMSNEISITVSMEGANINSNLDAEKVGRTVGAAAGDSLAGKLKEQATRRGYSVVNTRR